jgi:3-hydroxy-9,10-secoandrosta-1,3,5(10)-triene-9,17-dione monooxygenase
MAESTPSHRLVHEILDKAIESGALNAESIAVLHGSATGQALKPARHGGFARRADEFISEVCELAAIDGSIGWLAAVFNAAAFEVAMLSAPAADEVWTSDPEVLITTSYSGEGALAHDRRLTGRWEAVIGAEFADWLLLPADNGAARRVLVPRDAARIDPVRHHIGLDAAGICDVTVSDATVDDSHVFDGDRRAAVIAEAGAAAAVVGSADGVWRRHVEQERARLATSYGGDEVTNEAAAHMAWAASDIDAAKLQVTASLVLSDDHAAEPWAYQQAVARARGAADRLLANSRHALDATDPVTRLWRDVHAGCRMAVRFVDAL